MIYGIGIDIVEVKRIAKKILSKDFRDHVFSVGEIEFCESKGKNKAQHYAARFSAKEAFLKATGLGLQFTNDLNKIEVVSTDTGKPKIILKGSLAVIAKKNKWSLHLSLSHIKTTACASVIIESN